jgi:hypothetical protein
MIRAGRQAAAALCLICNLGCSVPPERVLLADFFAASRLRDLTALADLSTVVYEPREQGTISEFEIRSIAPARQDGSDLTKDVTVVAPVRTPQGGSVERTLVVTLRRPAKLPEDRPLYGGWKIVAIR